MEIHMKNRKAILFLLIVFIPALLCCNIIAGKVVSIQDGDTIEILSNNQTYRLRLDGIDCPEKSQAFGTRAKSATSDLCFGKQVSANIIGTDRYGRYLAKVILPDGKILNEELLSLGLAWHYKQYNSDIKYANLENQARKLKIGLWSDSSPIAPWDFRHGDQSPASVSGNAKYVGSKNSNKYHNPSCQWAKKIKSSNLVSFSSKKDAESKGYIPCKVCSP